MNIVNITRKLREMEFFTTLVRVGIVNLNRKRMRRKEKKNECKQMGISTDKM